MKIALVRPPKLMIKGTLTMKPAPPLGMAYIAGALVSDGHQVSVVDAIADGLDNFYDVGLGENIVVQGQTLQDIADKIPANVEMIGLSCMFSNNWLLDKTLINFLADKFPNAILVAGGESISSMPEYVLQNSKLHACVVGEGEEVIKQFAKTIETKQDWLNVPGIVHRKGNGIIKNVRRERIRDLDAITAPAWELFPTDLYFKHQITWIPTPARSLPMLATRGCPYTCTFCSSPQMWTTKYSLRSPQNILDEMIDLNKRFGVTNFELFDLTAIINRHWILDFCKLMQNHPQRFTWQMPAGTRSEALSSEVIDQMALAGCTNITFAPESGSPELLKSIKKKADPGNMLPAMTTASKHGMYVYLNIIIGLPGETHKDVWYTLWYLIKSAKAGADDTGVGVFMPYPGTVLFSELEQQGKLVFNEEYFYDILRIDSFMGSRFYNTNISSAVYRFYNIFILLAFYIASFTLRPGRIYKLFKNVWRKTYITRSEKTAGYLLEQIFARPSAVNNA